MPVYIPLRGIGRKRDGGATRTRHTAARMPRRAGMEATAIDPVCGMTVDPHTTPHRAEHHGRTYYFCSAGCREQVRRRSRKVSRRDAGHGRAGAGGHDLHLPDAPGDPAGRARRLPDLRHGARAGARRPPTPGRIPSSLDMTRRFWIGLALTRAGRSCWRWARTCSAILDLDADALELDPVRCSRRRSCCGPAGRSSCAAGNRCVTRNLNMFTLIALGTGVAYALQRRRDASRPASSRPPSAATTARSPVYFEAAAVITVLVLLGQVLELRARERHLRRDPRAARPRAEDRAPRHATTAAKRKSPLDARRGRRPAARAPGREGAGRRRGGRRPLGARRVDGDRRVDAGDQGARRQA